MSSSVRIAGSEDYRVLFWLFIDDLHKHKDDIVIQIKKDKKKQYPLIQSTLHHDIFYISLPLNQVFYERNKLIYRYYIKSYKTNNIYRELPYNYIQQPLFSIFDTPEEFVDKRYLKLFTYKLIVQKNSAESLLKFITPQTSIKMLNNLGEFIEILKFYSLMDQFYTEATQVMIYKLNTSVQYQDLIFEYFLFIESMQRYRPNIKEKYIVEISSAMSKYYTLFIDQIDDKERIRNRLIDLYSSRTNLDQRIKVLQCEYCVWSEQEAEQHIGKKDYNSQLANNPLIYIDIFSKSQTKYKALFERQIQRIIDQVMERDKGSFITFIERYKDHLLKLSKSQLESIQNEIFNFKNTSYYATKEKCIKIIANVQNIQEVFQISKYQIRLYLIKILNELRGASVYDKHTFQQLFKCIMQYKIDISEFDYVTREILLYPSNEHYQEQIEEIINTIINQNPFARLDTFILNLLKNSYQNVPLHKIPLQFQLKNVYEKYVRSLYEKQKQILSKREEKRVQRMHNDNNNKSLTDSKDKKEEESQSVQKPQENQNQSFPQDQINKDKNEWDTDIITDKQIYTLQKEQASALPHNQQMINPEEMKDKTYKKLKDELHQQQRQSQLTEASLKEFSQALTLRLENIIIETPLNSLYQLQNQYQFQSLSESEKLEFTTILVNRTWIKVKNENQNDEQFFSNYQSTKASQSRDLLNKQLNEVLFFFDHFACEKMSQQLNEAYTFSIFESKFVKTFLGCCERERKFYGTIKQYAQNALLIISNLTVNQFQILLKKPYLFDILKLVELSSNELLKIQNELNQEVEKINKYKAFFSQFQDFFPQEFISLQKYTNNNLQIQQIKDFLNYFVFYEPIANFYNWLIDSSVYKSILMELINTLLEKKEIQHLQNVEQQLNDQNQQLRLQDFTKLMLSLINELFEFCNLIFNKQRGSIPYLDQFDQLISQLLGTQIDQLDKQQQQKILQQQQAQLHQVQAQMLQAQQQAPINLLNLFNENQDNDQQQQNQIQPKYGHKHLLFSNKTCINDLKKYCGQTVEHFVSNLRIFYQKIGISSDFQQIEESIKKCYMTLFYVESSQLIKNISEIINSKIDHPQNVQMRNLLSIVSSNKDMKTLPIKEMMKVEISVEMIQNFQIILKLENFEKNMDLFYRSQTIIKNSQQNKEKNLSYLDMRDFVGDNDHDLSSLLTVMNEFAKFFTDLGDTLNQIISSNKSILEGIIDINNLIQKEIKSDQRRLQWDEITKNFFKIASIENNIDKKKSYLTLLKEMYTHGKTTIRISKNKQESTFEIECNKKIYSENEIREISSRVLIEKHSVNAVFEQDQMKQNNNNNNNMMPNPQLPVQPLGNIMMVNNSVQKIELKEKKMEDFKRQLELAQDLQSIIQEMIDYGYFMFEQEEYVYNNTNNKYNQNMEQMKQQLKQFENDLQNWKKLIENVIKTYPKFSFISYSYYSLLDSYLSRSSSDIFQQYVYQSIQQITKHQMQSQCFESSYAQRSIQDYQLCQKSDQLYFIAKFITMNQSYHEEGGMLKETKKRIRLIQYSFMKEAIYHLLSLNTEPENMKSQYYLFCDENTSIQDIQLFIQRYKYLNEKQNMNFFLILNYPQNSIHLDELVNLQNDQIYMNYFYILIKRDYYDEKLCQIQQSSIIEVQPSMISSIKLLPQIQEISKRVIFYYSKEPGSGKTETILKQSQQYPQKKLIRIPTNGDGNKNKLIKQIMKNIEDHEETQKVYHIDAYESSNIELNFILFEMIVLKSMNYTSKLFQDLGQSPIFLIEINNTLRKQLENSLCIKEYFQQKEVAFDIRNISVQTLNHNFHNQALLVFQYLKCMNTAQQTNNILFFDDKPNLQTLSAITSINQAEFASFLKTFIVDHLVSKRISPNFWQITNFISLFGKELEKMEQCIYLDIDQVERSQLRQGIRTTIIQKSFELCRKVSISCLQNNYNQNDNISNEQLLTNKADSLIQFSTYLQDFVTFQEQDYACVTSFFQKKETTPQSIQDMYAQQQQPLLLFDQEQRPEILIHWLMMLCNKNIQNLYANNKEISFDKIKNKELKSEVEKIIIQKDNFFKIAMIFLRIRAHTPVIIMGEAGIGKTALIRLLSLIMEANIKTKIIHAGITEDEIIKFIEDSENELKNKTAKYERSVLFFDEVNTNKLVSGLFKEIIVDRYIKGKKLNPNIIPIAALNPYKLKSAEQQQIMQIQIHGGIKKDFVNKIKGSDLEYTVNPIPESMYSFSWNFGGLKQEDEKSYITQILIQMNNELFFETRFQYNFEFVKTTFSELVFFSQQYIRQVMGRISACSLRDVKRYVTLLKNNISFLKVSTLIMEGHRQLLDIQDRDIENLAIYLSFYVNYCVRIPLNEKRRQYLQELTNRFKEYSNDSIKLNFEKVEKFLINQIEVPIGIAKNYSLRQNTFILFICIIHKIPICLIGPPGSSKTLSLRLLIQSMQGVNSRSELFKKYPALMPLYYQGHIQSTSERIMEVFDNAQKKQQAFNSKDLGHQNLSLVYIDEIGLAEISPHNPLKVLHATLEKPDISVACISNWPLDASKMNRMLTVYRMDVNEKQLTETFESIFEEIKEQQSDYLVKSLLDRSQLKKEETQKQIAKIYLDYIKMLKDNDKKYEQFHGPRDFFSACKLICSEEINSIESQRRNDSHPLVSKNLNDRIVKAFYRHFSGLENTQMLLNEQFKKLRIDHNYQFRPTELIEENLKEVPKFFISRHLMVISDDIQNATLFLKQKLYNKSHQFFIGSDFPEDTKMQACYNVINKIVACIEKGMIVILQNLDNIYQSLYEVLNQSYRYYNGKYFCKISFGAESSNIEVSKDFKLILLVNSNQIHRMDGPLLNRFEKHLLKDEMILSEQDSQNIQMFQQTLNYCINFQDIDTQNYPLLPISEIQKHHPFFRFKNEIIVIENFYLQFKLQKIQSQEGNEVLEINHEDQNLLLKRIFQLLDFFQIYLKSQDNMINESKDAYIKSGYHFSLNDFIQNRILQPNVDYVTSEWKYFQQRANMEECQVRLLSVLSPQSFTSDNQTENYEKIVLSSVSSEQELFKKISNFLNKGFPICVAPLNKKFTSTFQGQEHLEQQNQYMKYKNMSHIGKFVEEKKQEILFIIGDMSKQGFDSLERIIFTMQKIDEAVDQFLSTVKAQTGKQDYTVQLNVILLLKVEEIYTMIPVGGRWEYFYLENLTPFYSFKNESLDNDLQLFEEIKTNLSLKNILNSKSIQIQHFIKLDALILFYLQNDLQIFSQTYKNITYAQSEEINEYEYRKRRLEMIMQIFSKDSIYKQTYLQVLNIMVYATLKQRYKIERIDDLVFSYLMPKGLSAQSSSLHTSIMNGFKEMLIKSLLILIYHLESNGLIYGMIHCYKVNSFVEHAKHQIEEASKRYKLSKDNTLPKLKMQKDLIINESDQIAKIIQSLQVIAQNLKDNAMMNIDDQFSNIYSTAKQNLMIYDFHLTNFSEQILQDIQQVIQPVDPVDLKIVKAILLIKKQQFKYQPNSERMEEEGIFAKEQINLKGYKQFTDTLVPIYTVLLLIKDKLVDLRTLINLYSYYLSIDMIVETFINQYADQDILLSESIKQFTDLVILMIFNNIKPMSETIQKQKLLNYNYPSFTKPFIQFLSKNKLDAQQQKNKDLLLIINIICTEFYEILEEKNLIININFDKIMSLNYKELDEMREQFYEFFRDYYNRQSIIMTQPNVDFELLFLQKWNKYLKELIITSTEQDYYIGFDIYLIKILFQFELDELRANNNLISDEFKIYLNRVFKSIQKNLTIENTQKPFNMQQITKEYFSDTNGKPYHIEYYTFVLYGETIQQSVYQYSLNKKAHENIEFLFILIEHNFLELLTIQKIIYLSIFKEFVYQIVNMPNIKEGLLFNKIQSSHQNSMQEESQINEQFLQRANQLESELQKFFSSLTNLPLQSYVVKQILSSKKSIQDFASYSFYFKNSNWLRLYNQYSFDSVYNVPLSFIDSLIASKQQNYQQIIEDIVMKYINNSNNLFKEMYLGQIQQNSYYPFNMTNRIESQVDLYKISQGDSQFSLYQCINCQNYLALKTNAYNSIQCSCCGIQLDFKNQYSVLKIQQGLDNKVGLQQSITKQTGFCLELNLNNPFNSIKNCNFEIQRIFSLLYYTILNLSLRNIVNNPLNETTTIQYNRFDPSTQQIQPQQLNITLINKIFNIPVNCSPYDYINNQIYIAFTQIYQSMSVRQYSYKKVINVIDKVFSLILNTNIQQQPQLQIQQFQEQQMHQQIQSLIQEFNQQQLQNGIILLLKEDFSDFDKASNEYYSLYPKSLRINNYSFNPHKTLMLLSQIDRQNYLNQYFPFLPICLNIQQINQISLSLNTFITFYIKTMTYFSNQFEFSQLSKLTVATALNKIGKGSYDTFEGFYQTKFIPSWNDVKLKYFFLFYLLILIINLKLLHHLRFSRQQLPFDITQIDIINDDTKLINLIYSSKNQQSQFYLLLSYLIGYQNTFVDNLISYCDRFKQTYPQIYHLYSEIWAQYKNDKSKIEFGLQDIEPETNIFKKPDLLLLEKFSCFGLDERDCISENIIIDCINLQTQLIKQIFKNTKYISINMSLQFQFLHSFQEFIQSDKMIIPQEEIQYVLKKDLKVILNSKDIAYDVLQKITTIYSFFKLSPANHSETSLYGAMKQLNIRVSIKKLESCLQDHLKLKHLKSFISLLEEINMKNLIQLCNIYYKDTTPLDQQEKNLLSYIWQQVDLLQAFKIIIGRFIIRVLSFEQVTIDQNELLVTIINSPDINFEDEKEQFSRFGLYPFVSTIKVSRCYFIYEQICYFQNQQENSNQNQVQIGQGENNNNLFLENFTDDNRKKNIRQLTNKN